MNSRFPRLKGSRQERGRVLKDDRKVFDLAMTICLGVLADRFDFTEEQMHRFFDDCNTLIDSLYAERLDSIDEMQRVLREAYGLRVGVAKDAND